LKVAAIPAQGAAMDSILAVILDPSPPLEATMAAISSKASPRGLILAAMWATTARLSSNVAAT